MRAEVSPEDAAAGVKVCAVETNGTVRVALTVPQSRAVKWRITFGESYGRAVAPRPSRLSRSIPREYLPQNPGPVPPAPQVRIETLKPAKQKTGCVFGIGLVFC